MANSLTSLDTILPLLGPASNRGTKALNLRRHPYGTSQNRGREVALAHLRRSNGEKTWLCELSNATSDQNRNPMLMLLPLKKTR
ncbi:hypothetical protein B0G81_3441 [Paraburkholderia sp. BL6665CI2N2]|nr:hypothetical protein B0G81_3441 [Paraburkholderia sp. BL6665CI2N2]